MAGNGQVGYGSSNYVANILNVVATATMSVLVAISGWLVISMIEAKETLSRMEESNRYQSATLTDVATRIRELELFSARLERQQYQNDTEPFGPPGNTRRTVRETLQQQHGE